jgi:hypothetical protein
MPLIALTEAKQQLSIDDALTMHDERINLLIGAAIDWAENYTQRSLGELLELDSPSDSGASPLPDPIDSPRADEHFEEPGERAFNIGGLGDTSGWGDDEQSGDDDAGNPIRRDDSRPLRRDVKLALLLWIEGKFDRNVTNWDKIETTCQQMLSPYRIGLGV